VNTEEWIDANEERAAKAVLLASDELYGLLGGEPDFERLRAELAQEMEHLELTWRYPSS
jgi:hypothetical protein